MFGRVIPILRIFDLASAKRFYLDYLGCTLDWQEGRPDGPTYIQVSREDLVLHLSTHHDDGTPGGAVLIEINDVETLHRELDQKEYGFLNPGLEPAPGGGREMQLIDPFSNRLRFFERAQQPM